MLSRNLEKSLHRALALASDRGHEYATLEHLLMALAEDQDAIAVLRACGVDVARLGGETNPETELVLEVLLGASFNRELAEGLQLLAAPRMGEDPAGRNLAERGLLAGLHPLELDPNLRRLWLELWETEIRGQGRDLEGLSGSLDLILGILLLAFLFFVYTRMRREDRSDGTE